MNIIDIISNRRSIRKFKNKKIENKKILDLIEAAIWAPSAKNRQPWFFYIVNDDNKKDELVLLLKMGMKKLLEKYESQGISRVDIHSAFNSIETINQSAAVIFITHQKKYKNHYDDGVNWNLNALDVEVADLLSLGAAIQNMLLFATEQGLGTLWICDIFYAYNDLCKFLNTTDSIISAICIGYPNEHQNNKTRVKKENVIAFV